jgi:hypothetical protein
MKKFDEFDESIKHKLDGNNFQFNEANWEKMSQMIDASRPARKPFVNLPLISSIVVGSALVVGSVWFIMSDSGTKEVAQTKAVMANANSDAKVSDAIKTNVSTNNNTRDNNVLSSTENKTSANNPITSRKETSVNEETVRTAKKETMTMAKKTSAIKNTNDNSYGNNTNATANASSATKTQEPDLQVPVGPTENARSKDANSNSASTVEKQDNNSALLTAEQTKGDEAELESMPSQTTSLGQTAETIAAANLKTATVEEKKAWEYVRVKHHTFSLEGGAINSFGWNVNKTRNGNNISPVLGINYMYNFNSRSSLMLGLQYNSLANLGQAKVDFSVTTYGFGVNNEVTTYKLTDLHYLVMPIKYVHRINKNNALGFGANMMYLMNTRTMITKTTMIENNVSTSDSHYEMGYGFNQLNMFNTQLAVSYHHNISNKLAMNVELNKALMNVVKDYKYFGAKNTSSAPAAIKLTLTYTLFNK